MEEVLSLPFGATRDEEIAVQAQGPMEQRWNLDGCSNPTRKQNQALRFSTGRVIGVHPLKDHVLAETDGSLRLIQGLSSKLESFKDSSTVSVRVTTIEALMLGDLELGHWAMKSNTLFCTSKSRKGVVALDLHLHKKELQLRVLRLPHSVESALVLDEDPNMPELCDVLLAKPDGRPEILQLIETESLSWSQARMYSSQRDLQNISEILGVDQDTGSLYCLSGNGGYLQIIEPEPLEASKYEKEKGDPLAIPLGRKWNGLITYRLSDFVEQHGLQMITDSDVETPVLLFMAGTRGPNFSQGEILKLAIRNRKASEAQTIFRSSNFRTLKPQPLVDGSLLIPTPENTCIVLPNTYKARVPVMDGQFRS